MAIQNYVIGAPNARDGDTPYEAWSKAQGNLDEIVRNLEILANALGIPISQGVITFGEDVLYGDYSRVKYGYPEIKDDTTSEFFTLRLDSNGVLITQKQTVVSNYVGEVVNLDLGSHVRIRQGRWQLKDESAAKWYYLKTASGNLTTTLDTSADVTGGSASAYQVFGGLQSRISSGHLELYGSVDSRWRQLTIANDLIQMTIL